MQFEINVALKSWLVTYAADIGFRQDDPGMVVRKEQFSVGEHPLFTREGDQISMIDPEVSRRPFRLIRTF